MAGGNGKQRKNYGTAKAKSRKKPSTKTASKKPVSKKSKMA